MVSAPPLRHSHAQQCSQLVREKEQCGRELEEVRSKMEVLQRTVEQQQARLAAKVGPHPQGKGRGTWVEFRRVLMQWKA